METKVRELWNRIKNDEYLKNAFRIKDSINGGTFFYGLFIRFILFTFAALTIGSSVICMIFYYYLSYNLIKSRLSSFLKEKASFILAIILGIFWMLFFYNLFNIFGSVPLYGILFENLMYPDMQMLPFVTEARLAVHTMVIIQLVFACIFLVSALCIGLQKRSEGNSVFKDPGTYLSRKVYTKGVLWIIFSVILFFILFFAALFFAVDFDIDYLPGIISDAQWIPVFFSAALSLAVLILTLGRIKDMGFSRLWYLLIVPVSILGSLANPVMLYVYPAFFSMLGQDFILAFHLYLGRFIFLIFESYWSLSLIISMAFYFFPEKIHSAESKVDSVVSQGE